MFIMWFSGEKHLYNPFLKSLLSSSPRLSLSRPVPPGLRGAIPYALSLHLGLEPIEKRQLIGTTTIVIVLFTILLMGGGTMPLIRIMDIEDSQSRRRNRKYINLSKTEKMVSGFQHCVLSTCVGCILRCVELNALRSRRRLNGGASRHKPGEEE